MATHKTNSYDGRYMCFECSSEVTGPGKTKITWELYAKGGNSTYYYVGPITARINGEEVYSFDGRGQQATGRKAKGSFTVTHGTNGIGEYTWSIKAAIYKTTVNCTGSGTYTLASKNYPYTANGNPTNVKITFNGKSSTAVDNESTSFVYAVSSATIANWKSKAGGNDTVTLAWTAPTLGTNNSVENYIVQYYNDNDKAWVNWKTTTAKSITFNLSEISGSMLTHYRDKGHLFFQITANNKYGGDTSSYNVGLKAKTYWGAPTEYSLSYAITYKDYSNNGAVATKKGSFLDSDSKIIVPSTSNIIWTSGIQLTLLSINFNEGTPSNIMIKEDGSSITLRGSSITLNNSAIQKNTVSIYGDDGFGGVAATITFEPHTPENVPTVTPTFDSANGQWDFNTTSQEVRSSVLIYPSNYEIAKNIDPSSSISLLNNVVSLDTLANQSGSHSLRVRSIFNDGVIWSEPRIVSSANVYITSYKNLNFSNNSRKIAVTPVRNDQYELALIFIPQANIADVTKYTDESRTQITMTLKKSIASSEYVKVDGNTYQTNIPGQLLLQWVHRSSQPGAAILASQETLAVNTSNRLNIAYTEPKQIFSNATSSTIDVFQSGESTGNNFHKGFDIAAYSGLGNIEFVNKVEIAYDENTYTYNGKTPSYSDELTAGKITIPGFTYNDLFAKATLNVPLFNSDLSLDLTIYYNDGGIEEPHTVTLPCSSVPYYTIESLSLSSYGVFEKSLLTFSAGNCVNYANEINLKITEPGFNNKLTFDSSDISYSLAYQTNSFTYKITNNFEYITDKTALNQLTIHNVEIASKDFAFSRIAFSAQIPPINYAKVVNSNKIQIEFQNNEYGVSADLTNAMPSISCKVNNDPYTNTFNNNTVTIPLNPDTDKGKTVFNVTLTLTNSYVTKDVAATTEYIVFDVAPPLSLRKDVVGINTKNVENQTYKDACFVVTSTSGRNQIIFNGSDNTKITIDLSNGSISGATLDGGTWTQS